MLPIELPRVRAAGPPLVLALLGLAVLTGCDSPSASADDATFQLLLTGAPAAPASALLVDTEISAQEEEEEETPASADRVASAEVWISHIYLVGGGDGHVDLFLAEDDEDLLHIDLMELEEGVEIVLTEAVPVPEDSYGQLRLVVDEAVVTLNEGHEFADGSDVRPATVPSGFLRVNLDGELDVEGGEDHVLLVDFELSRSFVFQGPPEAPLGVMVKPVLFHERGHEVE